MSTDWERSIADLERLREKHVKTIEKLTEFTWNVAAKKDIERANKRINEITAVIRAKQGQAPLF